MSPGRSDVALVAALLLFLVLGMTTPAVVDPGQETTEPLLRFGDHWRDVGWAWALQLLLVLPLAWRRRAPDAVMAIVAGFAFVQWLAGPALYGDLALLVALYTVVAHGKSPRRAALLAGVTVILGGMLASQRWALGVPAANVALVTTLALPVALGLVARLRRRALVAAGESAAGAERTRIAREMHDVVAHNLSVMVALADGAQLTLARDPAAAQEAIGQVSRTGREALAEMRGLLGVLHEDGTAAPLRPQPGLAELPELAAAVRAAGVKVHLVVAPGPPLAPGHGLTVHRLVQESLTNVLKHARAATRVDIEVRRADGGVEVEVCDDGLPGPAGDGLGLRGMADRVAMYGGTLEAGPGNARGWRVHGTLPAR